MLLIFIYNNVFFLKILVNSFMKYIKDYEHSLVSNYNIGDYITMSDFFAKNNEEVLNCLRVVSLGYNPVRNDNDINYNVEFFHKDLDNSYFLSKSNIYSSQIVGYASSDDILLFESIENSMKYNL